jgi:hypothetical protein
MYQSQNSPPEVVYLFFAELKILIGVSTTRRWSLELSAVLGSFSFFGTVVNACAVGSASAI